MRRIALLALAVIGCADLPAAPQVRLDAGTYDYVAVVEGVSVAGTVSVEPFGDSLAVLWTVPGYEGTGYGAVVDGRWELHAPRTSTGYVRHELAVAGNGTSYECSAHWMWMEQQRVHPHQLQLHTEPVPCEVERR